MYYSGPDRFDVFHHTPVTPLAHLRYIDDRGEGWYTISQSGCLVSVNGPFASEQEARDSRAEQWARNLARRGIRQRLPDDE